MMAFAARKERQAAWLSASLGVLSVAVIAILASNQSEGQDERVALSLETIAALASGPTLFHYVLAAMKRPVRLRPTLLHYLPAGVAALAMPAIALGWIDPPAPLFLCLFQAGYTLAAALVLLRWRQSGDHSWHGLIWPVGALATMGAIHAGQLARLTGVAGRDDANIVALIGALGALGLLAAALAARQVSTKVAAARYARSSLDAVRLTAILERLTSELEVCFSRPDLSLPELSSAAGVPAHHASQALSEIGRTTFTELVAQRRVTEAKRLLSDPVNATVAVEPIGMEAGFRSRSAFYTAFRSVTGQTPAEFRRTIMSAPSGGDTEATEVANDRV